MAKMKRARQKFHTASQKKKSESNAAKNETEMEDDNTKMPPPDPTACLTDGINLFKDVDFSKLKLLKQKLPDFDARSSITSKTFKGQNLKKKDKNLLKKEAWMAKMDAIQTGKKKAKLRKVKQKTPIVGDLTLIEDALPTLELLLKKSSQSVTEKETSEKPRSIQKERKRKKQMLDDISLFHRVQQHPMFQENAESTIRDHLRHQMTQEQEMHS